MDAARDAWKQSSPYSWHCGNYTICAVRVKGAIHFELWHDREYLARAPDADTCRKLAADGGTVA